MNNAVFMYDETPEDELTDIPVDNIPVDDTESKQDQLDYAIYSLLNKIFEESSTDKALVDLFINPTSDDGVEYGDVIIIHSSDEYEYDAEYRAKIDAYVSDEGYEEDIDYIKDCIIIDSNHNPYNIGEIDRNLNIMHDYIIKAKNGSFDIRFSTCFYELELIQTKVVYANMDTGGWEGPDSIRIKDSYKLLPVYVCYLDVGGMEDDIQYDVSIAGMNKLISDIETHEIYCKLNDTLVTDFDFSHRSRNISLIKFPCPCCSE